MSVLIKGMKMPTSCSSCPMLEGDRDDGLCHAASRWLDDDEYWAWYVYPEGDMDLNKPCNCPLVPIPPHGRLIDADAAIANRNSEGNWGYDLFDLPDYLADCPTIIEAEGEDRKDEL